MSLPPGFRFHPTDEELVNYYLKKRVKNVPIEYHVIADVDLYKCEPWDLPSKSKLPGGDSEWFFFSPRDRKYPNGSRTNRATEAGYWKATGRDRTVRQGTKTIGMKKTLVFYKGRAPHGLRTDWLMHEYRLDGEEWQNMNVPQDAYVLCRVFKKNGFDPTTNTSGSTEESEQVDSPEGVNNITYDVKPNISNNLVSLPLLLPCGPGPCQEAVSVEDSGGNGPEYLAGRNPFSSDTDSDSFLVDEGLIKARNTENIGEGFEDIYSYCPPLEGGSLQLSDDDISNVFDMMDQTRTGRNESHKPWQEPAGGYPTFGSQIKHDDYFPTVFHENDFGPLPTLVQSPSPPTASSCQENDTEGLYPPFTKSNFTHFLPRKPSSVTAPLHPIGHGPPPYTAIRRVLLQRGITCTSSQEEGDESHHTSSDQESSAVSQTKKVEAGWTDLRTDCQKLSSKASTAVEDFTPQKPTVELVSGKEVSENVPSEDTDPGFSCNTESSTEDVPVKPAEVGGENVAVSSSPSKKSSGDESSSMRIMGLRMLEPICGLSDFSASGQTSSKGKMPSGELPAGISSIHVNAVTVTCSCSSAGLPHVPTKASACYCTFWEGRCEKEKPMKEETNGEQASEGRNNPCASFSVGFVILGILLYLMSVMLFFRAISTDFEREYLSFRDLLFVVLGAVFCSLVQLIRRRRV